MAGQRKEQLTVRAPIGDSVRVKQLFGRSATEELRNWTDGDEIEIFIADDDNLHKAKKYIESSRLLREGHFETLHCPKSDLYERIVHIRDQLEKDTCAALHFGLGNRMRKSGRSSSGGSKVIEVGGTEECVSKAIAMVYAKFGRENFVPLERTNESEEDSSYDSDYENSDPSPRTTGQKKQQHDEVSRTVSDTLAAEFEEYVGSGGSGRGNVDGSEDPSYDDPLYTSRVEFALKLGYTEQQVQIVLQKLGPKPEQNELLAELIKLGAVTTSQHQQLHKRIIRSPSGIGSDDTTTESSSLNDFRAVDSDHRHIVVDGSNVAMSHGNKEVFSCRGIKLCVDWFRARGHKEITVFVPMWRKEASRPDAIIKDQDILLDLERDGLLVFTPSRQMGGRRMACHDDRYILKLAVETDGVIVSNDNYRDLAAENAAFKKIVEERLLMFSFANDRFMPPDDPLGRHGPNLDTFLRSHNNQVPMTNKSSESSSSLPPPCPYGKKCTYGNKCKYYHPERGSHPHKSVSEQLAEQAKIHIQEVKSRGIRGLQDSEGQKLKAVLSSPLPCSSSSSSKVLSKTPLTRTKSLVPGTNMSDAIPNWTSSFYGTGSGSGGGDHLSVAKRLSATEPSKDDVSQGGNANLHRKLERQLTFNPVFDPRLLHLSQVASGKGGGGGGGGVHMPLSRHSSAGAAMEKMRPPPSTSPRLMHAGAHQAVTRIASAPDSYRHFRPQQQQIHQPHPSNNPHLQRMISTSDTQLQNMYSGFQGSVPFNYFQQQQSPPPPSSSPCFQQQQQPLFGAYEEQRYHLYYHLSSLFPEDQVRAAMEKFPKETDPQEICAAIFTMFPKGGGGGVVNSSVAACSSSGGNISLPFSQKR